MSSTTAAAGPRAGTPGARPGIAPGGRWPAESRVFAVAALVALVATPFGLGGLDASTQLRVVAVPALLAGLPHGAMDPVLARELGLWRDLRGAVRFHLAYLALAGLTVGAFVLAPVVALSAFLATTAWHFSGDQRDHAGTWVRLATGTALVSLPAVARPEQVGELYGLVTVAGASVVADVQSAAGPLVVGALLVALPVLWRRDRRSATEVGLTAATAVVAPPLVFFAVYFCLLHSPRHLREGVGVAGAGRAAVVYSLLAAGGLAVAGLLLAPSAGVDAAIASTVFVGLAALTAPHMLLVERAQRRAVLARPFGSAGVDA